MTGVRGRFMEPKITQNCGQTWGQEQDRGPEATSSVREKKTSGNW